MTFIVPSIVIPGLVPGIHVFAAVDDGNGRNKCGHDVHETFCASDEERTR